MEWVLAAMPLASLIFLPRTLFNGFALPQLLVVSLLSATGIVLGAVNGLVPVTVPSTIIILFAIYISMSVLWSDPLHNARKEIGLQIPLLITFLLACTYFNEDSIRSMSVIAAWSLAFCAIYANCQRHGVDHLFPNALKGGGPVDNPIGTIGNPNFLASWLCGMIWLGIYAGFTYDSALLIIPMFAIYVLFKTRSRGGQIGFAASALFFAAVASRYGLISGFIFHAILAAVIFGLFAVVYLLIVGWDTFWNKKIDPKGAQVWYATLRYRFCYWASALVLIKERLFCGGGPLHYRKDVYRAQAALNDKYPGFLDPERYLTPQPREVHNDFLENIVEYGLIGFALWMAFVGAMYYCGFQYLNDVAGSKSFVFMLILLSAMTAFLVDSIFFFALRIPSTASMFWIVCGAIVALSRHSVGGILELNGSVPLAIVVAIFAITFIWFCLIKRILASYHFARFCQSRRPNEKHGNMMKALKYAPNDTIYNTHMCVATMDSEPLMSFTHAMKIYQHFDGMTPLQVALFNVGLSRYKMRNVFDEAQLFFKSSHYILPTFEPSLQLLNDRIEGVGVRSTYHGGRAVMRIVEDGVLWKVRTMFSERDKMDLQIRLIQSETEKMSLQIESLKAQQQLAGANIENTLLTEKKRLSLPDNWVFNVDKGMFLDPAEMSEEEKRNMK